MGHGPERTRQNIKVKERGTIQDEGKWEQRVMPGVEEGSQVPIWAVYVQLSVGNGEF